MTILSGISAGNRGGIPHDAIPPTLAERPSGAYKLIIYSLFGICGAVYSVGPIGSVALCSLSLPLHDALTGKGGERTTEAGKAWQGALRTRDARQGERGKLVCSPLMGW